MSTLIYDIEIKKAILGRGESPVAGVEYCDGWQDHANMGVSCVGALWDERPRLFMDDNLNELADDILRAKTLVTFNGIAFDNVVLSLYSPEIAIAIKTTEATHYDILVEVWAASGLGPVFNYKTHGGFGLDAIAKANLFAGKTGHGAHAPVDYQKGRIGALVDYCLQDVAITARLYEQITRLGYLTCPKTGSKLEMRR